MLAAWLRSALTLDAVVFGAFLYITLANAPLVVDISVVGMALIFGAEWWFLRKEAASDDARD